MHIGLYKIKNLKVVDTEGKDIEKISFDNLDFNSYDPQNVCRDHYARIHFQWLSDTFHRLEEEAWKNSHNASKSRGPVSVAGTS